jgi:hypothetical protein
MMRLGVRQMHFDSRTVILALFSILLVASFGAAQEPEHQEHGTPLEHEAQGEEHAEEAEHEEHGEEHEGQPHHKNDFAIFLGGTDEHGHPTEFTWGLDYKRRVAEHWAVGGLFDYAGGELRNSIVAASVTWFPIGKLTLTAAPGIEFHRGRSSNEDCGCGESAKSEETGEADKNARYFILRLGVGWGFPIGQSYAIEPQVNLDLVNGEKVWVYGANFIYAW